MIKWLSVNKTVFRIKSSAKILCLITCSLSLMTSSM
jgi:hypothetical protein